VTAEVRLEKAGAIGWIVFDNQERRNAVTGPMLSQFGDILRSLAADGSVRVVALRGAGDRAFVSGADISAFGQAHGVDAGPRIEDLVAAMRALEKPLVAVLRGYCLGAGVLLALAADIRLAADDLRLGIPAARLGVAYPTVGVAQLVGLAGPAAASELLMTGRPYDSGGALAHGLVNRIVPAADLWAFAADYLAAMAANAPLTIAASKQTIAAVLVPGDAAAGDRAAKAQVTCFTSSDFREGQRAFLEKRAPHFEGR
jgi:enoyl-CoA hydratase